MKTRVKISGDGTPQGTRVEVDGKPLDNVERAMYCITADGTSWLTLELAGGVSVELDIEGEKREGGDGGGSADEPEG